MIVFAHCFLDDLTAVFGLLWAALTDVWCSFLETIEHVAHI